MIPCLYLLKLRLQPLRPLFVSRLTNYYRIQKIHLKPHQRILGMNASRIWIKLQVYNGSNCISMALGGLIFWKLFDEFLIYAIVKII